MKRVYFYLLAIILHLAVLFLVNPSAGKTLPPKVEDKYVEITLSAEQRPPGPGPDNQFKSAAAASGPIIAESPPPPAAPIAQEVIPPPPAPPLPPPPETPPPAPPVVEVAPEPPPPTPEATPSPAPVAEPLPAISDAPATDSSSADSLSAVSAFSEGDAASGGGNPGAQSGPGQGGGGGTRTWAKLLSDKTLLWPANSETQRIDAILHSSSNPTLVDGELAAVVTVRIRISRQGDVVQATLVKSSGFPLLDEAGIKTLRAYKFTPSLLNNTPAPEIRVYLLQYLFGYPPPPPPPPSPFRKR